MAGREGDQGNSDESTSDGEPELVYERPPLSLPLCRCPGQDLHTLVWLDGEHYGRCYECLNRVDVARLSAAGRLAYVVLRLLWVAQFCRR